MKIKDLSEKRGKIAPISMAVSLLLLLLSLFFSKTVYSLTSVAFITLAFMSLIPFAMQEDKDSVEHKTTKP